MIFKKITTFVISNYLIFLLIIAASLLLSYNISKPYWGHHDWSGAYWGTVARNYVRYGYFSTKLAMVENIGPAQPGNFQYTFHYSPLFPLLWSAIMFLFGTSEAASRISMSLISFITLFVFYQIVKPLCSKGVAFSTVVFWISNPMFVYFAKMPVHEIPVLLFMINAIYFFLKKYYYLSVFLIILAELTTWPGYFIVPALSIYWWINKEKYYSKRQIAGLWIISVLVFLSLLIHDFLLTGSFFGGGLKEIFFFRVHSVALIPYLSQLVRWSITYYTPVLLSLSLFSLIVLRKTKIWSVLVLLFVMAVIYPIVFRDASYRHDYLLIYFLPFLSFASALGLKVFIKNPKVYVLAGIILAIGMLLWRKDYIIALDNSDIYKESVRFGKYINANSQATDTVNYELLDPQVGFDGWHIAYYADRKIGNGGKTFTYLPGGIMTHD